MSFIDTVTKDLEKSGISVGESKPPRYWFSTGNHVLNKIISGSFHKGIPQGRMICFTGPSQAGKSFLLCNAMREAQKAGCHVVAIDTENALDDQFVSDIGVDINTNYTYIEADTIPEATKIVSSLIKGYSKEYGRDSDAPKLFIAIDSLDMLSTDTEQINFEKGVSKGDQGQRNKQLKAMQRNFVQNIKHYNISIATTAQVYKNQDLLNGEGLWIVSDAIRYAPSQIVLLTKLKLKDKDTLDISGIRMKCEGYKTRFTKPFQNVTIEVPYEAGMDPYNGLIDVAIDMGIITKKGAWCYYGENKWQGTKVLPSEYCSDVLADCEKRREKFLDAMVESAEIDLTEGSSPRSRRKSKADAKNG